MLDAEVAGSTTAVACVAVDDALEVSPDDASGEEVEFDAPATTAVGSDAVSVPTAEAADFPEVGEAAAWVTTAGVSASIDFAAVAEPTVPGEFGGAVVEATATRPADSPSPSREVVVVEADCPDPSFRSVFCALLLAATAPGEFDWGASSPDFPPGFVF